MNILSKPWLAGVACAAWLCGPRVAQADTTQDLAALRAEIAQLKDDYSSKVSQLEQRIEQLEASASAAPPTTPPDAATAAAAAPPPEAAPPVASAQSRGATAFNPAMSVILTGTYSNLSQDPASWHIAGFVPSGDEVGPGDRNFTLGESEITLSANVDPWFYANLTAALNGDGELGVEEAFVRTTSLPSGFTAKLGRFFSGIGYLNEVHAHAWDFVDQPLVYQAFLGGQLAQDGLQVKWLAPTDLFLEVGAEVGNGDAFPATRDHGNGMNMVALFAHVGGDIGDSIGWRTGLSWLDGDAVARSYDDTNAFGEPVVDAFTGKSRTWIADATLKWAPGGDSRRRALDIKAEYMHRTEDGSLSYDATGTALEGGYHSSQDGWYAQAIYRLGLQWRVGLRYDALDAGDSRIGLVNDGTLSPGDFPLLAAGSPRRVTLMTDWSPSEFTRLRLQYAWDDARDTGSTDEQWRLQYIYAIGAHGAHKF
jgi:hypothetical protein